MSNNLSILLKSQASLNDESLPLWKRVSQALEHLNGLTISRFTDETSDFLKKKLQSINEIKRNYDIKIADDHQKISTSDLNLIVEALTVTIRLCIAEETDLVIQELSPFNRLPVDAIEQVRQQPEIFVPRLLEELKHAIESVLAGEEVVSSVGFFAFFLLIELEVKEAFPLILDISRLTGDGACDLLGDAVHDILPPALALFARDRPQIVEEIIFDQKANEYVRAAAGSSYHFLLRDEAISRADVFAVLGRFLETCEDDPSYSLSAFIVINLADMGAHELTGLIEQAFRKNLIDEGIVGFEDIKSDLAGGVATFERNCQTLRSSGMPDTIAELQRWSCFQEKPSVPKHSPPPSPAASPIDVAHSNIPVPIQRPTLSPAKNANPKIGRNDSCPCGSGRKYKKCCLRKTAANL